MNIESIKSRLKFHDIKQNEEEWYAMRGQRVTMSKLGTVMANYGKAFGEPARKYAQQIAVERLTGKSIESTLSNRYLDRGHNFEPLAIRAYEGEMFCDVSNGGFFCNKFIGVSPDGLIGDLGLIEVKTAIAPVHFDRIRKQSFDTSYKWQMLGQMKFTRRSWVDFVSYCPEFPEDRRLYIYRLHASEYKNEYKMIDKRLSEFYHLVDEAIEVINNSSYMLHVTYATSGAA